MSGRMISWLSLAALWLVSCRVFADAGQRVVLPDAVTPQHYRIEFTPDARALTFKGSVEIDLTVNHATPVIMLNAADLVIDSASLSGEKDAPAISYDDQLQTATFTFAKPLAPGARTLRLAYHGTIYQSASGLFALDYKGIAGPGRGQSQRALFTQFENSDARRFVPCWDEPGLKATFELSATLPAGELPVSNMPVARTEKLAGGLQRVHFGKSPKMSTYLLYFSSGDFERVHRAVGGVDVGIVFKRGDASRAGYALDVASQLLPYFNDYFGVPYPLPKLDLIAGPGASQFFGAMENWGAIFYFEKFLLLDPAFTTQGEKQDLYNVVAHEMAHQWFGDLVTMAWWDDLWLNEGFASWMANKSTDHFHPEWNVWLQSLGKKQAVMQRDARDGTHAIITEVQDVFQATNAFDDITYDKGEAVLRALESHVGEAAFRAGVRRYMREHQYGNTVTDDLWREIDKESPVKISQVAHDITLQAGVPMVNLLSAHCEGGKTTLSLNQTHYAIDASSTTARVWQVPVKVATLGGAPSGVIVAGEKPTSVTVAGCGPVILNAGQGGYLRSKYTREALDALAAHFAQLSADDQLGVLNDSLSLAYTGELPMSAWLDLTKRFPASADPVVAQALVTQLSGIDRLYNGLATQAAFRVYARAALAPVFARVGWDARPGESDNAALLRASLIGALARFGDPAVIAETRARFERFSANPKAFSADARRSLLANVALQADAKTWERLHQRARETSSEMERKELYQLLGEPQDEALVRQALALVFSDELPPTLGPGILRGASKQHPEIALDYAIAHWGQLAKLLEVSSALQFLPGLASASADPSTADKLNAFADKNVPQSARQGYVLAVARVRYFAKVRETRLPEVDRWLQTPAG